MRMLKEHVSDTVRRIGCSIKIHSTKVQFQKRTLTERTAVVLKINSSSILEMDPEIFTDAMIRFGVGLKIILGEIRWNYRQKSVWPEFGHY